MRGLLFLLKVQVIVYNSTYQLMESLFSENSNSYTVSTLTDKIQKTIEDAFPSPVIVEGEVSNFKIYSSGHAYFSLKDSAAQISAVMFGARDKLRFDVKDGMYVKAMCRVTVYKTRGNYQILVLSMTQAGQGAILEDLEMRKGKFDAEGLFSKERRPIPEYPKAIGIVTSPAGAALRDILNVIRRRNGKVNVMIFPCAVQGESAAREIESQIRLANDSDFWRSEGRGLCDVLIVGRGGGSVEDLLPFSDELVVRAVHDSLIPVISAVGHQIDWALCDFAADARAETPTGAAELATPVTLDEISRKLEDAQGALDSALENRVERFRAVLRLFDKDHMEPCFRNIEQRYSERFNKAVSDMERGMERLFEARRAALKLCAQSLEAYNPASVLERGYSVVYSAEGKVVRSAAALSEGERVKARFLKGEISATVDSVNAEEDTL